MLNSVDVRSQVLHLTMHSNISSSQILELKASIFKIWSIKAVLSPTEEQLFAENHNVDKPMKPWLFRPSAHISCSWYQCDSVSIVVQKYSHSGWYDDVMFYNVILLLFWDICFEFRCYIIWDFDHSYVDIIQLSGASCIIIMLRLCLKNKYEQLAVSYVCLEEKNLMTNL